MEHARDEGEKQHDQREITDRHERHADEADEQNCLALSGVEHPADDRTAEDCNDGKERGGETRRRLRPAKMLHIEREGGEDHEVVEKNKKVDDDDEDEVARPELDLGLCHENTSKKRKRKTGCFKATGLTLVLHIAGVF